MKALYNADGEKLTQIMNDTANVIKRVKNEPDDWNKRKMVEAFVYPMAGDSNKELRQDVYTFLIGARFPKAKCGIIKIKHTIINKARL